MICFFKSSFPHILPHGDWNSLFTLKDKIKLVFRSIWGYELFYTVNDNKIMSYLFLKKDYLNKYTFIKSTDRMINPYYTVPEFRRQGLATAVVSQAMLFCKEKKYGLYAIVIADNISSINVLKNSGFSQIGYAQKIFMSIKFCQKPTNLIVFKYNY